MNTQQSPKLAILMLACRDYEAMELSLACHMAYGNPQIPFFILQNCRGNYDAERTLQVARRYEILYPERIRVIDYIAPDTPYKSISTLLAGEIFQDFDLVCKVDDDAFPIQHGWIDNLLALYQSAETQHGEKLAYVTPLINNNCWGFAETIKIMGLEKLFFSKYARSHLAGDLHEKKIWPAHVIKTGRDGTVWKLPYLARWIHEQTTLVPDRFIAATADLAPVAVPSDERYSIGCILFRKELWHQIDDGGTDDEHMLHMYCKKNEMLIYCQRSVPFVHIAYFTQREENRDILVDAGELYAQRLDLPYPIGLHKTRLLEIEARLRYIENKSSLNGDPNAVNPPKNALNRPKKRPGRKVEKAVRKLLYKLKLRSKAP